MDNGDHGRLDFYVAGLHESEHGNEEEYIANVMSLLQPESNRVGAQTEVSTIDQSPHQHATVYVYAPYMCADRAQGQRPRRQRAASGRRPGRDGPESPGRVGHTRPKRKWQVIRRDCFNQGGADGVVCEGKHVVVTFKLRSCDGLNVQNCVLKI